MSIALRRRSMLVTSRSSPASWERPRAAVGATASLPIRLCPSHPRARLADSVQRSPPSSPPFGSGERTPAALQVEFAVAIELGSCDGPSLAAPAQPGVLDAHWISMLCVPVLPVWLVATEASRAYCTASSSPSDGSCPVTPVG